MDSSVSGRQRTNMHPRRHTNSRGRQGGGGEAGSSEGAEAEEQAHRALAAHDSDLCHRRHGPLQPSPRGASSKESPSASPRRDSNVGRGDGATEADADTSTTLPFSDAVQPGRTPAPSVTSAVAQSRTRECRRTRNRPEDDVVDIAECRERLARARVQLERARAEEQPAIVSCNSGTSVMPDAMPEPRTAAQAAVAGSSRARGSVAHAQKRSGILVVDGALAVANARDAQAADAAARISQALPTDASGKPIAALDVEVLAARDLPVTKRVSKACDPYVLVYIDPPPGAARNIIDNEPGGAAALSGYVGRTATCWGDRWPKWSGAVGMSGSDSQTVDIESTEAVTLAPSAVFTFRGLRDARARVRFVVMDADSRAGLGQDVPLGTATMPFSSLLDQRRTTQWLTLSEAIVHADARSRGKNARQHRRRLVATCALRVRLRLRHSRVARLEVRQA